MVLLDALAFTTRDRRWMQKSIATTFSYLLLFPPFGYLIRIAQAVSRGEDRGLPEHEFASEFLYGLGIVIPWAVYQRRLYPDDRYDPMSCSCVPAVRG